MQNESCPISFKSINNTQSRIVAIINLFVVIAFIFTADFLYMVFTILDSLLRFFGFGDFSINTKLASTIQTVLKLKTSPHDIAPKKFALTLGIILQALIIMMVFFDLIFAQILATIFAMLLALDGFVGYCVGCKIYAILIRFGIIKHQ